MTNLKLKNAHIVSGAYDDNGMFEIVLSCRGKDMDGIIREAFGLEVEIKGKEIEHYGKR